MGREQPTIMCEQKGEICPAILKLENENNRLLNRISELEDENACLQDKILHLEEDLSEILNRLKDGRWGE